MLKYRHHPGVHRFPCELLIFPATLAIGTVVSVWLTGRIVRALETLALTNALDELEDRLSDVEKADIEGRIRERLFDEGHFGCCGR